MSIQLHVGAATDVGQVRSVNEDSFVIDHAVAAVADGMGGHRGGAVASRIAVETLWEHFEVGSLASLVAGTVGANTQIISQATAAPELAGMGTTMCAIGVIVSDEAERLGIVNVGDSRVYLLRSNTMEQVTVDHSLVESMVREGRLTPAEAEVHPQRNIVTRALGAHERVEVDQFVLEPMDGDRFLLCSDGLSNEVTDEAITQILVDHTDPSAATQMLVDTANANGGRDNITCVVVDVSVDDQTGTQRAKSEAPTLPDPVEVPAPAPTSRPAGTQQDSSADAPPPPAPRWRWWKRG